MSTPMWADGARRWSSREMEVIEANALALGLSVDVLMENAGRAVAEEAMKHLPPPPAVVAIVAGTGNNGGDGTCAAHYLHEWGQRPEVWFLRPPSTIRSHAARRCLERIERRIPIHVGVPTPADLSSAALVIDAMLGTGQDGLLRSPYAEGVASIRAAGIPTLAVDLPTGVTDPEGLRPSWTVTLTARKAEVDPSRAGDVTVRDIGIPPEAWTRTGPGEFLFLTPGAIGSRPGRTRRVVILGGGPYAGAPALAAMSALRSGAERATVVAPGGAAEIIQSFSPNLVVRPVGHDAFQAEDVPRMLEAIRAARPAAVALGMGAGASPGTLEALGKVEAELAGTIPLVVDADGLGPLLAATRDRPRSTPLLATPNVGEFERVFHGPVTTSVADRRRAVEQTAAGAGLTIVSKGDPDLLSDGSTTVENAHHHPAMTVGGVGDVLAGVLVSVLAQGVEALASARLATYWVGEAGVRAAGTRGYGLVATDVIDELPGAWVAGLSRVHHAE